MPGAASVLAARSALQRQRRREITARRNHWVSSTATTTATSTSTSSRRIAVVTRYIRRYRRTCLLSCSASSHPSAQGGLLRLASLSGFLLVEEVGQDVTRDGCSSLLADFGLEIPRGLQFEVLIAPEVGPQQAGADPAVSEVLRAVGVQEDEEPEGVTAQSLHEGVVLQPGELKPGVSLRGTHDTRTVGSIAWSCPGASIKPFLSNDFRSVSLSGQASGRRSVGVIGSFGRLGAPWARRSSRSTGPRRPR